MTSDEWESTDDLLLMLYAVAGQVSHHRLNLVMLACCDSFIPPAEVTTFHRAVDLLRLRVQGRLPKQAIKRLLECIRGERRRLADHPTAFLWEQAAELVATAPSDHRAPWYLVSIVLQATADRDLAPINLRRSRTHADLFREIIAPPIAAGWRSETVRLLADAIHCDQAYDRLPILADALEEAGCDSAELLNHCRGPGPHVFGCWALDLVRGCY